MLDKSIFVIQGTFGCRKLGHTFCVFHSFVSKTKNSGENINV